jgi:NAD(P)-dependent dehydrogenase (short-subunit alcohol dehydrogenase family)
MAATGPPFPSLTKTWHTTPYAAIDPLSPYLSAAGKTVLVTGGGSGIGAATVLAFAQAGAPRIAIIGRTLSSLERTKANINKSNPETKVLTVTGDISSKKSIDHAFTTVFDAFGKIDIFVASSGYLSSPAPVAELDTTDWFKAFEINALGMLYCLQAFKKIANNNAYLVNISTAIAHFPGIPGFSGYATSKLAGTKLVDYFAKENPEIHVVHLQPGVITTDVNIKSGMPGLDAGTF